MTHDWILGTDAPEPAALLRTQGFCLLSPRALAGCVGTPSHDLATLPAFWGDLPADEHLRDGGRYRFRRHGCYVQTIEPASLVATAHRAHWQPTTYNALHGGIERWFAPLDAAMAAQPAWPALVGGLGRLFAQVRGAARWHVEAHAFRIDTTDGVGRPTPEGAHRDGVDFVAVILVARHHVRGGETRVFDADGAHGVRFTLAEPWSALLMDDARVVHETTPIQPDGAHGHRDTLVLTYREAGFQAPAA
jgi:hypothetical protein